MTSCKTYKKAETRDCNKQRTHNNTTLKANWSVFSYHHVGWLCLHLYSAVGADMSNWSIIKPILSIQWNSIIGSARVVRWLEHLGAMCSRAWRALCAVGSRFNSSPGPGKARPPTQKYLCENNSYTHDDQGDNLGQATEGSTVSSIKCDRCWHLD